MKQGRDHPGARVTASAVHCIEQTKLFLCAEDHTQTKGRRFSFTRCSTGITGPEAGGRKQPCAWRKANKFSAPRMVTHSNWPIASIITSVQKAALPSALDPRKEGENCGDIHVNRCEDQSKWHTSCLLKYPRT